MPPEPDDSVSERGSIITEEELDLTRHDNVSELDDGRYLVSTGGPVEASSGASPDPTPADPASDEDPTDEAETGESLSEADVNAWLEDHYRDLDAQYGFHATAKFDDGVSRHQMASNDVVTSFESLLIWYAQHVGGGTPVEDVLGILLAESNVSVRYPVATLTGLLDRYDLDREDSVGDLIAAVSDEEAVALSDE
jgi:hypothetical protein